MPLPNNYAERVYSGVLGKIIGVYLGRPFEGWTYDKILQRLGEVTYYVNDRIGSEYHGSEGNADASSAGPPLVVTDDDITGTFTFIRALSDSEDPRDVTPREVGEAWLNYIIEERSILWWGGMGHSTEHTAYLRLKSGRQAPQSGATATNGPIIAEQIGAQIFIDSWAMVAPADPARAAALARIAASVSHDGEAIYAAQVLAAMESAAFVEADINTLLDVGLEQIPADSTIARLINDVRSWHAGEPDWHKTFAKIRDVYGYHRYGGNVHVVPNHALIILGLLYGNDDFTTSMKVVNTAGWDTDCNSGNLGCLMGIKTGLAAFEGDADWRGPVRDRILMPTADGGQTVTDAVLVAQGLVRVAEALAAPDGTTGVTPAPDATAGAHAHAVDWKRGARFTFAFPGSVQGFRADETATVLENVPGHSADGERALAVRYSGTTTVTSPTFILPEELGMRGYELLASPSLYPGQTVRVRLSADDPVTVRPVIRHYRHGGGLHEVAGPQHELAAGAADEISWRVPDTGAQPIAQVGIRAEAGDRASAFYIDSISWDGTPEVTLSRPAAPEADGGHGAAHDQVWRRAWTNGMDSWLWYARSAYSLAQNHGRGLLMQGTRGWTDYEAAAVVSVSLAAAAGIAVRAQGMRRYYALLLTAGGEVRLVKMIGNEEQLLARATLDWQCETPYRLRLRVQGSTLTARVNETVVLEATDTGRLLTGGAAAFVLEEGHLTSEEMIVRG